MAQGGIDWKQEAQGRERIYFVVFLLLIPLMFGRVVWGPKRVKTAEVAQELKNVMLQVDTVKNRLTEVKKIQAARAGARPTETSAAATNGDGRFAPYMQGLVRSRQEVMSDIVKRLTGPQALKGIALNGHSIGSDVDAGTYLTVPLELNLEGPFAALVQYFDAVEKMPLLLTIDNITLNAVTEAPGRIQVRLATTVYVVKSAAAITSGATVPPTPATGAAQQ